MVYQRSILTATVVAELELNSISPPPDTVEEEKKEKTKGTRSLKEKVLTGEPNLVKVNSKPEIR